MYVNAPEILILWQLDKVLCKWCTTMWSKGKLESGPMIIVTVKSSSVEMKIISNCTFSVGWLQSNKNYLWKIWLLYVLLENLEYLIIQHLSGPIDDGLKNSTVHNILCKYFSVCKNILVLSMEWAWIYSYYNTVSFNFHYKLMLTTDTLYTANFLS